MLASADDLLIVDDLCELAQRKDPALAQFAQGTPLVLACFERAVRWLFHAGGAPLPEEAGVINLRKADGAEVARQLGLDAPTERLADGPGVEAANECEVAQRTGAAGYAWFPVLDYGRCVNCKQCQGFCLFGVYGLDEQGQVHVEHPENCKPNCPACARVCPKQAIVFPKFPDGPIAGSTESSPPSGGEGEITDDSLGPAQVELSPLLRGDVMAKLRQRGLGGAKSHDAK